MATALSIENKIEKSKLSAETREIFSMLISFFGEVLKKKDERVNALEVKVENLEKQVMKLEDAIDDNSQKARKDTFIVSGGELPTSHENEDCKIVVRDLFRKHLKLNIDTTDFSTAHRLGRRRNGEDKRSILVKAYRCDLVNDIYVACRTVKPPFYVNPSMTPVRGKILFFLRKLKKLYPEQIKGSRSYNGEPQVVMHTPTRPTRNKNISKPRTLPIPTREALDKFVVNELKSEPTDLGISW